MTEPNDDEQWFTVVPPKRLIHADALWAEWRSRRAAEIPDNDVRVDTVAGGDGADLRCYRVRNIDVPLTLDDLASALRANCPAAATIVESHLSDWNGEVVGSLLVAAIRRHLEVAFTESGGRNACGCLAQLDTAITTGDAIVRNVIAVSFVEDSGWYEPARQPFITTWPEALRTEVEVQRRMS